MPDLTPQAVEALRDLLNRLAPNLALALAEQLNRDIDLQNPQIESVPIHDLLDDTNGVLATSFSLGGALNGECLLVIAENTAGILADLMAGGEGAPLPDDLTEAQTKMLGNAMSGLARGLAVGLTNLTGDTIELDSSFTNFGPLTLPPVFALNNSALQARFTLVIPDLPDNEMLLLLTPEMAQALAPEPSEDADGGDVLSEDDLAAMLNDIGGLGGGSAPAAPAAEPSLPNFAGSGSALSESHLPRGLDLILDIPLDVTVELGRVRMIIKDVLELASGSIIELDRVAGEPVDLLVNGRLIAKGEVVVIEDNFGIRITEIVSPTDRVAGLGRGR